MFIIIKGFKINNDVDFFFIIIIKGLCFKINYDVDIKKEMNFVFEGFCDKRDYLYLIIVKIIYLE